jgi:hypothetical protein
MGPCSSIWSFSRGRVDFRDFGRRQATNGLLAARKRADRVSGGVIPRLTNAEHSNAINSSRSGVACVYEAAWSDQTDAVRERAHGGVKCVKN